MTCRSWLAGAVCVAASAQTGQITGPVLGYFHDAAAKKIRPIHGVPSAGLIGSPLPLEGAVAAAAGPGFVLALQGDERRPVLITPSRSAPVEGASAGATHVIAGPDSAALVFAAERRIELLNVRTRAIEKLAIPALRGAIGAISVSRGRVAIAGTEDSGVYVVSSSGTLSFTPAPARVTAVSLDDRGLAVISGAELLLFNDANLLQRSVALPAAGATAVVRTSEGGAIAAWAKSGRLVTVSPRGAAVESKCDCAIEGLTPTTHRDAWQLTSGTRLVQVSSGTARILFNASEVGQ